MKKVLILMLLYNGLCGSDYFYQIKIINKRSTRKPFGAHSYGSPTLYQSKNDSSYSVGKFCSIADNVIFMLGSNHRTNWISTYPFMAFPHHFPEAKDISGHPYSKGPIIIGNDVWIGSSVTILSGVTIGDGAIIGARSVVAKNVPPYTIVVGNPARVVKLRFSPEQIAKLLLLKWWNWPIHRIRQNIHLLCSANIENFLQANDTY